MQTRIKEFATAALLGGLAVALPGAPIAAADAGVCSAVGVVGAVNSATGSTQQYLSSHPGAAQVLYAAIGQSRAQADAGVRSYFTANPQEYYDLRGILAPIGDVQRDCNVAVLPPTLEAAYNQLMAG